MVELVGVENLMIWRRTLLQWLHSLCELSDLSLARVKGDVALLGLVLLRQPLSLLICHGGLMMVGYDLDDLDLFLVFHLLVFLLGLGCRCLCGLFLHGRRQGFGSWLFDQAFKHEVRGLGVFVGSLLFFVHHRDLGHHHLRALDHLALILNISDLELG